MHKWSLQGEARVARSATLRGWESGLTGSLLGFAVWAALMGLAGPGQAQTASDQASPRPVLVERTTHTRSVGSDESGRRTETLAVQETGAAPLTGRDAQSKGVQARAEPAGYRPLVKEAVDEFSSGNVAEARALFARAHELYPNARTHRGMGLADFELRNYVECIRQLRAALTSEVRPLDPVLRSEAEEVLARARGFVGQVVVDAKPAESRVLLDGVPVPARGKQPFLALPGDHVVRVEAPRHVPQQRKLKVKGGKKLRVALALQPVAGRRDRAEKEEAAWYESPWLWTAALAVAAGAVTTGVVLANGSDTTQQPWGGSTGVVITGPSGSP
ncbi:MAG: PEGA domain-containing protein [Myxococcales bacterium]|nr:PEGA domain-containing protein [Myxococcales bacterium]